MFKIRVKKIKNVFFRLKTSKRDVYEIYEIHKIPNSENSNITSNITKFSATYSQKDIDYYFERGFWIKIDNDHVEDKNKT
jgi:hypothetical protein